MSKRTDRIAALESVPAVSMFLDIYDRLVEAGRMQEAKSVEEKIFIFLDEADSLRTEKEKKEIYRRGMLDSARSRKSQN